MIAVEGIVARWIGDFQRAVVRVLLREDIRRPAPFRRGPGFLGWLQGALRDPAAWRARLYILLKVPLAMGSFYVAIVAWAAGLFWTTYPFWWQLSGPGSARQATRDPALDAGSIIGRGTARAAVPEAHTATLHLGHFTADT